MKLLTSGKLCVYVFFVHNVRRGLIMLAFVDQETKIKVFRVKGANGQSKRERVGVIRKKDFALDEDLEALPSDDREVIDKVVSFYNDGMKYETLAALYDLPSTLRKVTDHVVASGSQVERDMVMMSIVEAIRTLKRADSQNWGPA